MIKSELLFLSRRGFARKDQWTKMSFKNNTEVDGKTVNHPVLIIFVTI